MNEMELLLMNYQLDYIVDQLINVIKMIFHNLTFLLSMKKRMIVNANSTSTTFYFDVVNAIE
jgi:hypothetical protein